MSTMQLRGGMPPKVEAVKVPSIQKEGRRMVTVSDPEQPQHNQSSTFALSYLVLPFEEVNGVVEMKSVFMSMYCHDAQ